MSSVWVKWYDKNTILFQFVFLFCYAWGWKILPYTYWLLCFSFWSDPLPIFLDCLPFSYRLQKQVNPNIALVLSHLNVFLLIFIDSLYMKEISPLSEMCYKYLSFDWLMILWCIFIYIFNIFVIKCINL